MAAQSAAEWAPAAVSASIASYGAAAGFGVAAYLAALGLGTAAAAGVSGAGGAAGGGGGGYAKGGLTGTNEIARVGEQGPEFIFTAKATRNVGVDRLYAAMHAAERAPRFGAGGVALPTGPGEIDPPILFGADARNYGPRFTGDPSGSGLTSPHLFGGIAPGGPIVEIGRGGGPSGRDGLTIVPDPVTGAPILVRASPTSTGPGGGRAGGAGRSADYLGYGASAMSRADALIMASQAFGGVANLGQPDQIGYTGDDFGSYLSSPGALAANPFGASRFSNGQPQNQAALWALNRNGPSRIAENLAWQMAGRPYITSNSFKNAAPLGHHADGGRIPGPASRADNILALLSPGERIIPADREAILTEKFGFDWDKKFAIERPRFASGGTVARPSSSSSPGGSGSGRPTKFIIVGDMKAAARAAQEEPEYENRIIDMLNRNRHEIAIGPIQ